MVILQPIYIVDDRIVSGLDAAVVGIDGLMLRDLGVLKAGCLLLGREHLDVLAQCALIAFEGEDVIGLLLDDLLGDLALAAHGIDGYDGALDRQHIEKCRNGDDLVRFVRHLDLAEYQTLACRESGHHMDRGLSSPFVGGST
jgi:hypothetical protein